MVAVASHPVQGHVSPGFEAVREAFDENFARRGELGGACCAYHRGEKVVDLWGGIRNKQTGEPWERDTMVVVHSATKGLAAMTLAVAHSRGWLDYEERVATYWPEFAQNGKEKITVRQLLAHQAGLFAFDEPVDRARGRRPGPFGGRDGPSEAGVGARHATGLSRAHPGVLRGRADAPHRSPASHAWGSSSRTRSRRRSDEDFYIRLPEEIPNSRLATLSPPGPIDMLIGFRPLRLARGAEPPLEHLSRARREPGCVGLPRRAARLRAQPGGASRRRRRHGARHRARVRRRSPPADASWGCDRRRSTCWRRQRFLRRAGSMTNA